MTRERLTAWVLVVVLLLLVLPAAAPTRVFAEGPEQERLLSIERRLLCPQCTNLRLDVCETQLCFDMRAQIRERVAAGESDQQIVGYFTGRYGQRVLADVPARGFNLVLFGWVGGAIVLVGAAGAYALYTMRRDSDRRHLARAAATPGDDRWVDDLLDDSTSDVTGDAPRGTR